MVDHLLKLFQSSAASSGMQTTQWRKFKICYIYISILNI